MRGDGAAKELAAHVRSCGYGSRASKAITEKGSYREEDVIAFLRRHLRDWPADATARGKWRILMADDHGPHKTEAVRRLAWHHGDELIVHGEGTTAVGQPVDTDLNQHVKRFYMAAETAALL